MADCLYMYYNLTVNLPYSASLAPLCHYVYVSLGFAFKELDVLVIFQNGLG